MCNSIFIDKNTIPKAKDGEEFELTIKGIYRTDEDGTRNVEVLEVEGNEVVGPEEDCGCGGDLMDQNSEDALRLFVIKTKPRK